MTTLLDPRHIQTPLVRLNARARDIFKRIVESYLATGEPVGSRNLSKLLPMALSPASVRNVMQELEELGLIYSPHTSAGRLPTHLGLRFFVDALLEWGDLPEGERRRIDTEVQGRFSDPHDRGGAVGGDHPVVGPHARGRGSGHD